LPVFIRNRKEVLGIAISLHRGEKNRGVSYCATKRQTTRQGTCTI